MRRGGANHARLRCPMRGSLDRRALGRSSRNPGLDDLAATLRPLPAQLARNTEAIERLGEELHSMRADFGAMRANFSAMQRQIAQIGWTLSAALVGVLVALVVAVV